MVADNNNAEKKKELQQLLSEMDAEDVVDVINNDLSAEKKNAVAGISEKKGGPGRPWKPGQSGNPKGRPKNQFSFAKQFRNSFNKKASELEPTKKIAAEHGIDPDTITIGELYAVTMLVDSMRGRDSIAKEIIQRIDGKVPDVIIADVVPTGLSKLTDEQLKQLARSAMNEMDNDETKNDE
jgi:hypothetical protein